MGFIFKLMTIIGFITLVTAATVPIPQSPEETKEVPDYRPQPYETAPTDSYQFPTQLPLALELPREAPAPVPFYSPEPSTELKAPVFIENEPDYYQAPIPAQDLVAPVETQWNPNNDPKFYYEVPVLVTKQELPTNLYPKKFNKDIHSKEKPFSSRPKQEITLDPINEVQYVLKQKELHKTFDNLAKKENQKQIQVDKISKINNSRFSNSDVELEAEATDSDFHSSGLKAELTSSLGIPFHASQGERVDFHMVGHDGPYSYKWGYDTGKGHNRQFRFEERNKEGIVKGHYGFYDKTGKLQMVNYDSHPHTGFHAESNSGN